MTRNSFSQYAEIQLWLRHGLTMKQGSLAFKCNPQSYLQDKRTHPEENTAIDALRDHLLTKSDQRCWSPEQWKEYRETSSPKDPTVITYSNLCSAGEECCKNHPILSHFALHFVHSKSRLHEVSMINDEPWQKAHIDDDEMYDALQGGCATPSSKVDSVISTCGDHAEEGRLLHSLSTQGFSNWHPDVTGCSTSTRFFATQLQGSGNSAPTTPTKAPPESWSGDRGGISETSGVTQPHPTVSTADLGD